MKNFVSFVAISGIIVLSCTTAPAATSSAVLLEELSSSLIFDGIETESSHRLHVIFSLKIDNPFPLAGRAAIESWQVHINGQNIHAGLSLENAQEAPNNFPIKAAGNGNSEITLIPLRLSMDMDTLASSGLVPVDHYEISLAANLGVTFDFDFKQSAKVEVVGFAAFPGVQPPCFSITDITILQVELINTRLRITMHIDNPNVFSMDLSSFAYTFYGNGQLWADRKERNIVQVPAQSSVEIDLYVSMNFTGMSRHLLDQVANLADVNYRFVGEAQVSTGLVCLPSFTTAFDLSGYSRVLER